LADAEVEVLSWSAATGELVLRVRKELGPEAGLLRFAGVGHASLPPRLTVAGISASAQIDGDTRFVLEAAWGGSYTIVAESVEYDIQAEPSVVHRRNIERYPGSLADLAGEVGDLRYDAVAEFVRALAAKLAADGDADAGRGRPKLASALHAASETLTSAAAEIDRVWAICAPRM
jgi:hypothetical protein